MSWSYLFVIRNSSIQRHFSLSARDSGGGIMREPMFIIIYADFIVEEFL